VAKKNKDISDYEYDMSTNKFTSFLIAVVIIAIWLVFFGLLIKFDIGGFGSSVMRPIFEDVPIINKILPKADSDEEEEYPYKSLAEAINYIKELELELENANELADNKDEVIADLQSEIDRLKSFENDQLEFERIKEQFYNEVVFGDTAIDYNYYKQYYESIEPEYAEVLYQQVVEKYLYDEQVQELANAYSEMKPARAADALYEMTGNLETVVAILKCMETEERAKVLDALSTKDPVFCGKITEMLAP